MFYRILSPLGLLPKNCKYGNKKFDFNHLPLYTLCPLIGLPVGWSISPSLYTYITTLTPGSVTYTEKQDSGKCKKKVNLTYLVVFAVFAIFAFFAVSEPLTCSS